MKKVALTIAYRWCLSMAAIVGGVIALHISQLLQAYGLIHVLHYFN